jgi:hypothetical protein
MPTIYLFYAIHPIPERRLTIILAPGQDNISMGTDGIWMEL